MEELKQDISKWANGISIKGETKNELRISLRSALRELKQKLNNNARDFYIRIDNLDDDV